MKGTPSPSPFSSLNRRRFLHGAMASAASLVAFPTLLQSAPSDKLTRKPNLIVFLPDQQRADTIEGFGAALGRVHAPHLNKLASQSTIFERTYVTHPVCTPSRSSLITGTWPHTNGSTHNNMALAPQWKTFPEMLNDPDYQTAYMGKWHLGDEVFPQRGFQEWVSIEDMYQAYFSPSRDRKTISDYSKFLLSKGQKPDNEDGSFSRDAASNLPLELSKPVFLENQAKEFIERNRNKPFILFISFLEPHNPYNGPLNNEHTLEEVEFEPSASKNFEKNIPLRYRLRQELQVSEYGDSLAQFRKTKRKYQGLVTQIDLSIGRILAQLDNLGLGETTIVAHTSDHGDMMGAHRLFQKEVMFEPSTRVPFLIRLPGQQKQIQVKQPVSHIDFVPALLDLLGAKPHPQCDGKSIAPLAKGETMPAENVFIEWSPNVSKKVKKGTTLATPEEIDRACGESIRTVVSPEGWKLSLHDTGEGELYNINDDPYEMKNHFGEESLQEIHKKLTSEILAWQKRTTDKIVFS